MIYSNGIRNYHSEFKCHAPGVLTGRSGTIGKVFFVNEDYWAHNTTLWVTDFFNNSPKFIFYMYQSINIEQFSSGSGVPTLNRNDVHEYKTGVPSAQEQNKIATFLSFLDERISKQRELIEKLKTYKRGLIRDFLSNNCSYELRTLESLFEIKAGGDISKENCQTNQSPHFPYPVYANSLTNKGLYGYANYYKICGDTITVTGRGEIGHATARHENYVPIVRLLSLIPKTELDVDFFAEIINETNIFVESTGVPQLTSPQLGKVQVPWIEPSVQKNCAQIIKTIDNLVTKQQQIYNILFLYKNGLLQQMFI